MARKLKKFSPSEREKAVEILFSSATSVQGEKSLTRFLDELLTASEKVTLGRRVWIARLLLSGYSQAEVNEKLKLSPNTTSKVHKWLKEQLPGYEDAVEKLKQEAEERSKEKRNMNKNKEDYAVPFTFGHMKKKYPMHFLLFNLTDELSRK